MSRKLSVEQLQQVLDTYDDGVLSVGSHKANSGAYCALECVSLARHGGRERFTDCPTVLGMPDLRPLNDVEDALWGGKQARTQALLPLLAALSDWAEWPVERQQRWAEQVVIETVRQLVAELPELPEVVQTRCRGVTTVQEAEVAARAAEAAARAAEAAAWAAKAAAEAAAEAAAWAAARAAARAARTAAEAAAEAVAAAWAAKAAARAAKAAATPVLLCAVQIWLDAVEQSK